MDWFRSWHGAPTDPKWLVIAKRANVAPGIVSAVAWALMDYASQNEDRGSVAGFDIETYATFSGFDEADVAAVINAMRAKGIIEDDRLSAWEKRQPKREDDSAERVAAWRARNAQTADETQPQTHVTQCNAPIRTVTQCNAPDKIRVDTDINDPTDRAAAPQPPATPPAPTADAGPTAQSDPLQECIAYLQRPNANKPGAVGRLYSIRYGARYPPDYARLGALAKQLSGSYTALAELIWRSTVPDGDPHDYLQGCVNGTPARKGTTRKDGSNGQQRTSIADGRRAGDHNREPNAAELAAFERLRDQLRQQSAGEAPPA